LKYKDEEARIEGHKGGKVDWYRRTIVTSWGSQIAGKSSTGESLK